MKLYPLFASAWGDGASVVGVILGIWALLRTAKAETAVREVVKRNSTVLLALELSQAIEVGQVLLREKTRSAWDVQNDAFRNRLASCRRHALLARDEQLAIRSAIVDLKLSEFKNVRTQASIREALDMLLQIRSRLLHAAMETKR